jgi:enamine deaminase RidA (YjgF/YER057c/UK114 family)
VRVVGYSRAVRIGPFIEVGGTTSTASDGSVLHPGDVYKQTRQALEVVRDAIVELGGSLENVVRTRVFLKDISRWEEAGRAHGEAFGSILPTSSFLECQNFLDPEILVEIEATAIVEDPAPE